MIDGLTFTIGSASGGSTVTFTASLANVNATLAALDIRDTAVSDLQVDANDLGSFDPGGALTDSATITLTIDRPDPPKDDKDDDESCSTGRNTNHLWLLLVARALFGLARACYKRGRDNPLA